MPVFNKANNMLCSCLIIILLLATYIPAFAESKDVTMKVGESATLNLPSSVTSLNLKSVNFYSNGIQYVQVLSYSNFSVNVKAVRAFSSPIIVRCDYRYFVGSGNYTYEASGYYDFNITVIDDGKIQPTSISFPSSAIGLEIGDTRQLSPTVLPADAEYTLTWTISDSHIATVSQSGLVTALSAGDADLKVSADNGVYAMLRISVFKPSPTSVTVTPSNIILKENETYGLSASVLPAVANQAVTWSSSDENVASVSSSGRVKALTEGSCYIRAKTSNGCVGSCSVTVTKQLEPVVPTDKESWIGTYSLTSYISMHLISNHTYAYHPQIVIEPGVDQLYVTSFIAFENIPANPDNGLEFVEESPSRAYIDLGKNNVIGNGTIKKTGKNCTLLLSTDQDFSASSDRLYISRSNTETLEIDDFYIFALPEDSTSPELDAMFLNCTGSRLSTTVDDVSPDLETNEIVTVYNITGRVIFVGSNDCIPDLEKGLYFIKGKRVTKKLLVK